MKSCTLINERDAEAELYVGDVSGFRGAHAQASTFRELQANLAEVVAMLREDGESRLEADIVRTQAACGA